MPKFESGDLIRSKYDKRMFLIKGCEGDKYRLYVLRRSDGYCHNGSYNEYVVRISFCDVDFVKV